MPADFKIEVICKQGIELDTKQASLGKQRAVLLHGGDKVFRCVIFREYHSFPTEGANLGAADVECITVFGDHGQRYIRLRAHKAIPKACTIKVKRKVKTMADIGNSGKFLFRIECPVLCGIGDIDHPGADHVLMGGILPECVQVLLELPGVDFSVVLRKRKHLVSIALNGPALMDAYVAGLGSNDAFIIM